MFPRAGRFSAGWGAEQVPRPLSPHPPLSPRGSRRPVRVRISQAVLWERSFPAWFRGLHGHQCPQVKKCHESIFTVVLIPVFLLPCINTVVVPACSSRLERRCRVLAELWENVQGRFSWFRFSWCSQTRVSPCMVPVLQHRGLHVGHVLLEEAPPFLKNVRPKIF